MLTIKCTACKSKLFKYKKIGKGRVLTCWNERIYKSYCDTSPEVIKCKCGQIIGKKIKGGIRMKQGSFTSSGNRDSK